MLAEVFTLFIMAFALGMDAFSLSVGMGMLNLRLRQVFYIGLVIGLFHILMPFAGLLIGKLLSVHLGMIATFIGGGLLIFLGLQMLYSATKQETNVFIRPVGFGLIIFSLSVSLDSFSVGLSLGLFGAKTIIVILTFGLMSMLLAWLGLLLGRYVKGWVGSYAEVLGGLILLGLGIKLIFPM